MSTHIEMKVSLPDTKTLNELSDLCLSETGSEPDIDEILLTAFIILHSHGDRLIIKSFIDEHGGKIIEENIDDNE